MCSDEVEQISLLPKHLTLCVNTLSRVLLLPTPSTLSSSASCYVGEPPYGTYHRLLKVHQSQLVQNEVSLLKFLLLESKKTTAKEKVKDKQNTNWNKQRLKPSYVLCTPNRGKPHPKRLLTNKKSWGEENHTPKKTTHKQEILGRGQPHPQKDYSQTRSPGERTTTPPKRLLIKSWGEDNHMHTHQKNATLHHW